MEDDNDDYDDDNDDDDDDGMVQIILIWMNASFNK